MNEMEPSHASNSFGIVVPKVTRPADLKLQRFVLAQVALCAIPAMWLVALGSPPAAGKLFYLILLPLLARYLLMRNWLGFITLTSGVIPVLMLLRGFFYYHAMILILITGMVLCHVVSLKEFSQLWKDRRCKWLLFLGSSYWILSFIWERDYTANLRALELVSSAVGIYLLARHRGYLATALIGVGISACSVGLGLLPYGDRLGAMYVEGYVLGNPITVGIPLALVFLLSIADNGKWLLLENRYYWRLTLAMTSSALLILSTSRGSWAIVIVNLIVLLSKGRRQRRMLAVLIVLSVLVTLALLRTERGSSITDFFEKTFGADRSLVQRTTGRSDQWMIFPYALMDSPLWGFGPGSGPFVYAEYSARYAIRENQTIHAAGHAKEWHSLYLQVGVEAGIIGLLGLTLFLALILFRSFRHWRLTGESAPLVGVLGFIVIGLSVAGLDAASGLFLGLGILDVKSKGTRRHTFQQCGDHNLKPLSRDRVIPANSWTGSKSYG